MPPSPFYDDVDRPLPYVRLVIVGILLLTLSVAAVIGSRGTAEEDAMQGKLAGILDPGLRNKMANYAENMAVIRPAIQVETIDGHYSTDNCAGFVGLAGREGRARALAEHPMASVYQDCLVMRVLHNARRLVEYIAPASGLARAVVNRLDPVSLKALAPSWGGKAHRLADLAAERFDVGERRVELVQGSASWSLEVVATAEITGSPVEDLVVRIDRGTGAPGYMVLVAHDGGTLKALPLDVFVIGGGAAVAQF